MKTIKIALISFALVFGIATATSASEGDHHKKDKACCTKDAKCEKKEKDAKCEKECCKKDAEKKDAEKNGAASVSCCGTDSECCFPGSACCDTVASASCCGDGGDCCFPGSACCDEKC